MEYRRIGRSGLKVSEICLGTMGFGRDSDQAGVQQQVDLAFDAGVNFFDTSNAYTTGVAETMLGNALKGRRRDAVVATKVFHAMGPYPNDSGLSRAHIMQALEDSLRRLQMDYVDIYYCHQIDPQTPIEETLRAMDDLVHQGKVRYMACSNWPAWRLMKGLGLSDRLNLYRFECYQGQYSLVVRDLEQEVLQACAEEGLGLIAWSPLAGGFLTGKYPTGARTMEGTRSAEGWGIRQTDFHANSDEIVTTLLDVARQLGKSAPQVALRWVLDRPGVSSAIVGARTIEQLRDNLGVDGWHVPAAAMEALNKVSWLPDRFPWIMQQNTIRWRDSNVKMPSLKQ